MTYILAAYELDRAFGGSEEGGWWFNTGQLVRPIALVKDETKAYALARRANRLLDHLQRHKRDIGSMAYSGGRHGVYVYENVAPLAFPEQRPYYE